MNNFYFNLRLQKPLKIQYNIDNYRAYLWDSGILTETAPITDKELKKYYKEDIGRADIYYEVEEYDYNEEKAFKAVATMAVLERIDSRIALNTMGNILSKI